VIIGEDGRDLPVNSPVLQLQGLNQTWEGRARRAAQKMRLPVADIATRSIERFLKKHKVQVILGEYLDGSLKWLPLAQELGIRFFGHAHGYDVSMRLREAKWRTEYLRYNQSDGIVTMSESSCQRLRDLGIHRSKIHVIPYGVEVPGSSRKRMPSKSVRCVAVGRTVTKKAPILTLDAFRRASEAVPTLHLDYVGVGELLLAAQQFVRAFDLGTRVTFHGRQPNQTVRKLMDEADIFVQHSMTDPETGDEEGLPVAILEAMSAALPVVSTRHAGIPEAVVDGSTGYLVNEGESAAMAERLIILARNHDLRERLGAAGWARAKEHFTWDRERASLLHILINRSQG